MPKGVIPRFSAEIEEALQQVMSAQAASDQQSSSSPTLGSSSQQQQQTSPNSSAPAAASSGLPPTHPGTSTAGGATTSSIPSTASASGQQQAAAGSQQQQQQQASGSSSTQQPASSSSSSSPSAALNDLSVFDMPNFSSVDFVNKRFPDEASLDGLGSYIEEVRRRLSDTESSLLDAVRVQACTAATAGRDLDQAKKAVLALRSRVEDIKTKADHSEATVDSICSSIRQLDTAKRNLTESIVTINQLQLFLRAVQGLGKAIDTRNYASVNDLLRQAMRYSERFEPYFDVPKVKELQVKLIALKRRVSQSVVTDILHELCPSLRRYAHGASQTRLEEEGLVQACLVVDALGVEVMEEVRKEFIASQLEEYTAYLFKRGSREAALERTERRFIWFRQLLEKHEALFLTVFPLHWYVMQEMCVEFAMRTAEELRHQLRYESGSVEVAVLIYMLQKTMDAEKDLTSRMKWYEMELREKLKIVQAQQQQLLQQQQSLEHHLGHHNQQDGSSSAHGGGGKSRLPLQQALSPTAVREYKVFGFMTSCFDDYLDKYVQHEDQSMQQTIEQQLEADSINEELLVLQSTQDIFLFIQESMRRAATITSSRSQSTLTDLCGVWHRHLNDYARTLQKLSGAVPSSKDDERTMCVLVNSADYCRSAAEGLGEDLLRLLDDKEAIGQTHADVVANFSQVCTFASTQLAEAVCTNLGALVNDYQTYLASGASSSGAAHLSSETIDESFFPPAVRRILHEHFTNFATYLLPNLFSFVITKAATTFIPRLNRLLYRPKGGRLTQIVVSQMRVDMNPLERAFAAAPNHAVSAARDATQNPFSSRLASGGSGGGAGAGGAGGRSQASAGGAESFSSPAFTKTVRREFGRIIAALRVLQLPPGERFIEGYYQTVDKEDRSETDCARLLELLGVSKEDQRQWIALLKRRGDVPFQTRRDNIVAMMGGSSSSSGGSSAGAGGGQQGGAGGAAGGSQGGSGDQRGSVSSRLVSLFGGNESGGGGGGAQRGAAGGGGGGGGTSTSGGDAWEKLKSSLFKK